jgi:hypothetical protein
MPRGDERGASGTMATKPTKSQQKALENFAEALVLIADGARLDGKGRLDRGAFLRIAEEVARASSAFNLDEIVIRALELRARAAGLPGSAVELLTLMDVEIGPPEMLLLPIEEFKSLVETLEAELGDV